MSKVFVLATNKQPLDPVHAGRVRILLKEGKAAVFKRYPFTIILKAAIEKPQVHPVHAPRQHAHRAGQARLPVRGLYFLYPLRPEAALRYGHTPDNRRQYYRDAAKARRLPCPAGGNLMVRIDLVDEQFGDLLKSLKLPENWREIIRRDMVAQVLTAGVTPETVEREKERLKLKKSRTLKVYREDYIDEEEFQAEMAAVELALKQLDAPEVDGVTYDEVIEAGEHLPGMAALWDVATAEERREMVTLMLEPGGMYVDLELKIVAAIKPRPAFLPILRMLDGVVEYDETRGLIVTENWQERNRRHRPRSHQCWSTSIHPLVSSLKSSNNCSNTIRLAEVIPFCRQSPTGIQVPPNLAMRFLLRNGRLCYAVSLRTRNRCVKSLTITESPTKRSGES